MNKANINPPNGSSESVILHAAIASWAGFVYQGLCALCVAMEKLLTVPESSGWYLNVEGYEDFAILDDKKQILSFHQCKDFKTKKSWKDEFKKMEDKRYYWNQKEMCGADVPLYFHINMDIGYSNGVERYRYKNDTEITPNTEEVFGLLSDLVSEYCQMKCLTIPAGRVRNRLIVLMEEQVNTLDVEDKKSRNNTQQISVEKSIPFNEIEEVIRSAETDQTLDEKTRLSICYLNIHLNDRLLDNPNVDAKRIIDFLDTVNRMDIEQQSHLVKRLFPDVNVERGRNVAAEISNSTRANYLFNLLVEIQEGLNLGEIHWQNDGIRQSPSTMGNDKRPEEYCGKIAINHTLPPELFRDYRWLVGCFNHSVDDIFEAAVNIGRVKPIDYKDITKVGKTGLLSIKDKNDGRIR